MTIIEEIQRMKSIGFSKSEVIHNLREKGVGLSAIESCINDFYPKIVGVDKKSISFILTFACLTIFSLLPLIGLYLMNEYRYIVLTLLLLGLTFGFYRLNKMSLIIWLTLTGLLICFIGFVFFYKISGSYTNSLYSFKNMISVLPFLSVFFRSLLDVYNKNRRYKQSV